MKRPVFYFGEIRERVGRFIKVVLKSMEIWKYVLYVKYVSFSCQYAE